MASNQTKSKTKKQRAKRPKNKSWTEKEVNTFVSVLTSNEERDTPWALTLETMALKKSSNEAVFRKILEELQLRCPDSSGFTIDQLRRKYKWLKQEWRKINNKIRSGSGLAGKDTNSPEWYSLLNPILTEAVDGMMTLSSKATDVESEESSSGESSEQEIWSDATTSSSKVHVTRKRRRSSTSINTDEDDSDVEKDGGCLEGNFENSAEDKKLKRKENTDVKMSTSFKSTKRAPKTQTAALWQMVKGMEEISKQQEKKSDERLAAMLNMEMKRDEMLLAFQKEQAEQNRQHELMLAQLLVQPGKNFGNPVGPSSIGNLTPHGYDASFAMVSGHHVDVSSISGVGQNYPNSFEGDASKVYHKL